jgi:hypothetical protein
MTSSNFDPPTGRPLNDGERDSISVNGPDYSGDAEPGYAAENDPDVVAGFGERDHSNDGSDYDPASGDRGDSTPAEGFDPGLGAPGYLEDSSSEDDVLSTETTAGVTTRGDRPGAESHGDDGENGVKQKAERVAGQVEEQAGAVKESVTEQAATVKDTVTQQAGKVTDVAVRRAEDVAGVTKEELARLTSDARGQLQTLWNQAAGQLREQAGAGQRQLADLVHGLASELGELASTADSDGPVTSLLKQAAHRSGQFSHWLADAETGDVLTEVRRFARRRPVAFLAGATLAGVVVGRLSRGLMAAAKSDQGGAPTGTGTTRDFPSDPAGGLDDELSGITPATTGTVSEPPVSYAEVPDFSSGPASTVDTGYPGQLSGERPATTDLAGGDQR